MVSADTPLARSSETEFSCRDLFINLESSIGGHNNQDRSDLLNTFHRCGQIENTMQRLIRFLRDTDGPTAVEYAVLLALMVGAMVASITYVGNEIHGISEANEAALDGALTPDE